MRSSFFSSRAAWMKAVSVVVAVCFISVSVLKDARAATAGAEGASPAFAAGQPPLVDALTLPAGLGEVRDVVAGDSGRVVVHLQDAHCNYSCQKSISEIIGHLNAEYGMDLALLEGGAGDYDLSPFTDIEDASLRSRVADHFVRQGRLNGAELYAVNNPGSIELKGLEDEALYKKQLAVYRDAIKDRAKAEEFLAGLERGLSRLKSRVYSGEILELDRMKSAYEREDSTPGIYFNYLSGLAERLGVDLLRREVFRAIMEVLDRESGIDFKKADAEKNHLIDELTRKVSAAELERLVRMTVRFKKGNVRAGLYFSYLFTKAGSIDIDPYEDCPDLALYKEYIGIYESVDKRALFKEIEAVEEDVFGKLFENDAQRELYRACGAFSLLKKLFDAGLSREEYEEYLASGEYASPAELLDLIRSMAARYGMEAQAPAGSRDAAENFRKKMERFYRLAFSRDRAFVREIISRVSGGRESVIVVSGGFHGKSLKEALVVKGFSYVSIVPALDAAEECPYFKLLSGGLSAEEELVSRAVSAIAIESMLDEMELEAGDGEISELAVMLRAAAEQGKKLVVDVKSDSGLIKSVVFFPQGDGGYEIRELLGRLAEDAARAEVHVEHKDSRSTGKCPLFIDRLNSGAFPDEIAHDGEKAGYVDQMCGYVYCERTPHPAADGLSDSDIEDILKNISVLSGDVLKKAAETFRKYFYLEPEDRRIDPDDVLRAIDTIGINSFMKVLDDGINGYPLTRDKCEKLVRQAAPDVADDPFRVRNTAWSITRFYGARPALVALRSITAAAGEDSASAVIRQIVPAKRASALLDICLRSGVDIEDALEFRYRLRDRRRFERLVADGLSDKKMTDGDFAVFEKYFRMLPCQRQRCAAVNAMLCSAKHADAIRAAMGSLLLGEAPGVGNERLGSFLARYRGMYLEDMRIITEYIDDYMSASGKAGNNKEKAKALKPVKSIYAREDFSRKLIKKSAGKEAAEGLIKRLERLRKRVEAPAVAPGYRIPKSLFPALFYMLLSCGDERWEEAEDFLSRLARIFNAVGSFVRLGKESGTAFLWNSLSENIAVLAEGMKEYTLSSGSGSVYEAVFSVLDDSRLDAGGAAEKDLIRLARDAASVFGKVGQVAQLYCNPKNRFAKEAAAKAGKFLTALEAGAVERDALEDALLAYGEVMAGDLIRLFREKDVIDAEGEAQIIGYVTRGANVHGVGAGYDILDAMRKYFSGLDEQMHYRLLCDALVRWISGKFAEWKYDEDGYTALLREVVASEAAALGEEDAKAFKEADAYSPLKKLSLVKGQAFDRIRRRISDIKKWENDIEYEVSLGGREYNLFFTGDFARLFNIGTVKDFVSCQSPYTTDKEDRKRGLLGYCVNGCNKAVALYDADGNLVARRIVRLALRKRGSSVEPVIFVEEKEKYGKDPVHVEALYSMIRIISARTGLPVCRGWMACDKAISVTQGAGTPESVDLYLLPGRSPWDYSDNYGHHSTQKVDTDGLLHLQRDEVIRGINCRVTGVPGLEKEDFISGEASPPAAHFEAGKLEKAAENAAEMVAAPGREETCPVDISEAAENMYGACRDASLLNHPCTIGVVVRARLGDNVDALMLESFCEKIESADRRLERKIQVQRNRGGGIVGYEIGDIRYVAYVDDGTASDENLKRLEEFKACLEACGSPKERTFAWVLSGEGRDARYFDTLREVAHLAGLEGEYPPVSWQMISGVLFANLIDSVSGDGTSGAERVGAIVDSIMRSLGSIAAGDDADWMAGLEEKLRSVTKDELAEIFNGISVVLPLAVALTGDIKENRKNDMAFVTSL